MTSLSAYPLVIWPRYHWLRSFAVNRTWTCHPHQL